MLVASRPPEGIYWSIRALVSAVIAQVPEAEGVSREYVRQIMVGKLGILSCGTLSPSGFVRCGAQPLRRELS